MYPRRLGLLYLHRRGKGIPEASGFSRDKTFIKLKTSKLSEFFRCTSAVRSFMIGSTWKFVPQNEDKGKLWHLSEVDSAAYHNSSLWSSSTAEQRHGTASELQRKWKINSRILPREGLVKGSLQYWVKQGPTDDVWKRWGGKVVRTTRWCVCCPGPVIQHGVKMLFTGPLTSESPSEGANTPSRRRPLYDVWWRGNCSLHTAHSDWRVLQCFNTLERFYTSTNQSSCNFHPHLSTLIYYWERAQSHGATTDLKLIISKTSEVVLDKKLNMDVAACKPTP